MQSKNIKREFSWISRPKGSNVKEKRSNQYSVQSQLDKCCLSFLFFLCREQFFRCQSLAKAQFHFYLQLSSTNQNIIKIDPRFLKLPSKSSKLPHCLLDLSFRLLKLSLHLLSVIIKQPQFLMHLAQFFVLFCARIYYSPIFQLVHVIELWLLFGRWSLRV